MKRDRGWLRRIVLATFGMAAVAAGTACGGGASSDATSTVGGGETATPERSWAGSTAAPEFPEGLSWFNVQQPPTLEALRGKIVLIDFWTLGCINCQHIVPDLTRLEEEFADSLVVLGVHSGKYAAEQNDEAIQEAVRRLGITHAVANDADFVFWERYGAHAWPTLILIDPAGNFVGAHAGEGVYDLFQPIVASIEQEFAATIDPTPFPTFQDASVASSVLKYPAAIATDERRGLLYIADAGHDRILVSTLDGELVRAIGDGVSGFADGAAGESRFQQPQGLTLSSDGRMLYVADTRNHAIRAVDTATWEVRTIAGNGQRLDLFPRAGADPKDVALASPWGLLERDGKLYIAMAGSHQLWVMDIAANTIEVFAGTSREGLDDGLRLTQATLAQPSGLATDGEFLYWVDPEGSAARRVGFGSDSIVDTLVGTGLFDYGNEDGGPGKGQLQHAQGIAYLNGTLYITDTYNHTIRTLDPVSWTLGTLSGDGTPGWADGTGEVSQFNEPAALAVADGKLYVADTNNHLLRIVDPVSGAATTLTLSNLAVAEASGARDVLQVRLDEQAVAPGTTNLRLKVTAPDGYRLNGNAPSALTLTSSNPAVIDPGEKEISWNSDEVDFSASIPVALGTGTAELTFSGYAYFCRYGEEALCFISRLEVTAPVRVETGAVAGEVSVAIELPAA